MNLAVGDRFEVLADPPDVPAIDEVVARLQNGPRLPDEFMQTAPRQFRPRNGPTVPQPRQRRRPRKSWYDVGVDRSLWRLGLLIQLESLPMWMIQRNTSSLHMTFVAADLQI